MERTVQAFSTARAHSSGCKALRTKIIMAICEGKSASEEGVRWWKAYIDGSRLDRAREPIL